MSGQSRRLSLETVGSVETLTKRLTAITHIAQASGRVTACTVIGLTGVVLLGIIPWRLTAAEPEAAPSTSLPAVKKSSVAIHPPAGPSAEESQAVAEIKKLGGRVNVFVNEKSPKQALYFVMFDKTHLTDGGLIPVARLSQLFSLHLRGTSITDAGLAHLKGLKHLRNLMLDGTQVTDAGLVHLEGLTLEKIGLKGTRVTNAGLASLKKISGLYLLDVRNTKMACKEVSMLSDLRILEIGDSTTGDPGLRHLKSLGKLDVLDLEDTGIDDAGLEQLIGMSQLRWLHLQGTVVTDEGIKKLREVLPHCQILR